MGVLDKTTKYNFHPCNTINTPESETCTVNSEIFTRNVFFRIVLKDIFFIFAKKKILDLQYLISLKN